MSKIQNAWQVRRSFKVASASGQIHSLTGADTVSWNQKGDRITVLYDIRTTDYETILQQLFNAGVVVRRGFWSRWLGKMYQSSDQIGRENAQARPAPCCNKPPR